MDSVQGTGPEAQLPQPPVASQQNSHSFAGEEDTLRRLHRDDVPEVPDLQRKLQSFGGQSQESVALLYGSAI